MLSSFLPPSAVADRAREKHAVELWLVSAGSALYHEVLAAEVLLHYKLALQNVAEQHASVVVDLAAGSRPSPLHVLGAFEHLSAAEALATAQVVP